MRLADNSFFWDSFRIGLIWAVSVTVLQLVLALGLAQLLNSGLRLQGLTRVLALIPWAMPPVVVAIMWKMIYSPNAGGPLNAFLGGAIGLPDDINWLADFSTALPAVIVVGVWVGMPPDDRDPARRPPADPPRRAARGRVHGRGRTRGADSPP